MNMLSHNLHGHDILRDFSVGLSSLLQHGYRSGGPPYAPDYLIAVRFRLECIDNYITIFTNYTFVVVGILSLCFRSTYN